MMRPACSDPVLTSTLPTPPPPPPRLIVCLAAGARSRSCLQPEVILAALQTAAAGLRALQLPFPCLCSAVLAPPLPSGSKIDNHRSGLKKMKGGREKRLEAWQRFALNGRETAGGAVFGDSGSRSGLLSEDSAKCLHRWMDLIIPDGRERKSSCGGKKEYENWPDHFEKCQLISLQVLASD